MAKTYRTGLVITGDASDGVKAINLTRDQLDKLNKTGQKTRAQMRETSAESERFTASLGSVAHKAAAWGAAFVGVNAIMGQFTQQLSSVDRIHKLNLRIGASTEALSEYAYVAELSGTNIEQLAVAWQRQTRRIAEAAQGTGVAKAALEELNLSATTLRTLAPEDQFMAIAGALENVAEKGDRLRLANAIFDSEGAAAALQIINQGTDAMERMLERAQTLGVTVFQDQANSIANYNDAVTDMRYAWEGVNRVLAVNAAEFATDGLIELAEVIPTVTNALEYLDEAMIAGVAVTAGRAGGALAEKTKKLVASSQAARAAAESELYLAKQAQMRAVQDQAAAQRSLANAASMEARSAAGTRLARANQQVIATTKLMDAATANYQRTATLAGRAAAGLRNTMAFFGGPLGVVTMAVTAFALLSPRLSENKIEASELSAEVKKLTRDIDNLTIAQAAQRLQQLESGEAYKLAQTEARKYAAQVETFTMRLEQFPNSAKADEWRKSLVDARGELDTARGVLSEYTKAQADLKSHIERANAAQTDQAGSIAVTSKAYADLNAKLDDVARINKDYYEIVQEITNLDDSHIKKQELLEKAAQKRTQALDQLNKKQQTSTRITKDEIDKNQQLIQSLGDEIELMQLSGRERAIQTELRKLDADATESQILAIRHLAGVNYDQQQAALAAKEELKLAAEQTNIWADITENAVNSVDNSFRELFRSGLDGWDDFWDQMLDTAKDMLAELAYTLVKQQLWVNVGMNVTGQGGAVGAIAGQGGSMMNNAGSLLQNGTSLLRNGVDFFNPSSGYTTMAVNQTAASLGYGYAADGMGPPVALVDSGGYVAQGLNAVGPGFAAYGFGQKYGVAGGLAGGVGSAALAGGIGGAMAGTGFMAGAGTALAGLGPVGWAAIAIGALLGGLGGGEPSNKMGTATADLTSGEVTIGGQTGDKFSQENRDAAESLTGIIANTLLPQLSALSGADLTSAGSVYTGVGNRDALAFKYSTADGQTYGFGRYARDNMADYIITPDGTVVPKSEATPGRGGNATALLTRDPSEALNTVVKFFAKQNDAWQGIYDVLGGGDELTIDTMRRVQGQAALYSGAEDFYSALLPTVSGMFTQNAVDWKAQLAGTEPEQPAYANPGYSFLPASTAVDWSAGIEEALSQALTQTAGLEGRSQEFADIFVASLAADLENAAIAADHDFSGDLATRLDQILADAIGSLESGDGLTAQIMGEFIGRDIYAAFAQGSETQLETVGRVVGAFNIVSGVFDNLGLEIDAIGIEALSASNRLVELSGGLDALTAGANYYYQNYFTEQERAQIQVDSYTAMLSQFNAEFDTALSGRDDLRAFVESLDLTSESGQSAYVAAMQLAPALVELEAALSVVNEPARLLAARGQELQATVSDVAWGWMSDSEKLQVYRDQISAFNETLGLTGVAAIDTRDELTVYLRSLDLSTEAGQAAADAALAQVSAIEAVTAARVSAEEVERQAAADREQAAAEARRRAEQAAAEEQRRLLQALNDAKAAYASAINREISAVNQQISAQQSARSAAEATANSWRSVVDSLADARRELIADTLAPDQTRIGAMALFNEALSQTWAGSLDAAQSLPGLAQSAQSATRDTSATGTEYRLATAALVAQLDSAGSVAGRQVSTQELIIDAADRQIAAYQIQIEQLEAQAAALQEIGRNTLTLAEAAEAYYAAQAAYQAGVTTEASTQLIALQTVDASVQAAASDQALQHQAASEQSADQHDAQADLQLDSLDELDSANKTLSRIDAAQHQYARAVMSMAERHHLEQLAQLQNVVSAVQSIDITLVSSSDGLPKYADGGIASGPASGYPVELHGTEAIIPLKGGAVPVSLNDGGMRSELRALRAAMAQLNDDIRRIGGQQIKSAQKVESILRKFDIDGLPDVRTAS